MGRTRLRLRSSIARRGARALSAHGAPRRVTTWRALSSAAGRSSRHAGAARRASIRKTASVAVKARTNARAADLAPVIEELRLAGKTTLAELARALSERGIPTARGGTHWSPVQVSRVLRQLEASNPCRE
jgi:hypothetical protein